MISRGAVGWDEARLVDLGGRLGPDGAARLAALLLAAPPPGLTTLGLRFPKGGEISCGISRGMFRFVRCYGATMDAAGRQNNILFIFVAGSRQSQV